MEDVVLVVCAGLAVLVGLAAAVVAVRARAESAALRARLDGLERRQPERVAASPGPVEPLEPVEPLGRAEPVEVAATLPAPVFADMVLRESVIRVASWTHGVRRALSPEQRMRIRFAIRRGTKQARKQRRSDLRAALRELAVADRAAADPREDAA